MRRTQGKSEEAEANFERARDILTAAHGPSHPQLADPIAGLAHIHRDRQDHADAARLFARALQLRESELHAEHPLLPEILEPYADSLRAQGELTEAQTLEERAQRIRAAHPRRG